MSKPAPIMKVIIFLMKISELVLITEKSRAIL